MFFDRRVEPAIYWSFVFIESHGDYPIVLLVARAKSGVLERGTSGLLLRLGPVLRPRPRRKVLRRLKASLVRAIFSAMSQKACPARCSFLSSVRFLPRLLPMNVSALQPFQSLPVKLRQLFSFC